MSFQQGLSGLSAASAALDSIGNNVANSGTVGYKLSKTQFADVFAASLSGAGTSPIGLGTKVASVAQQFTQGNVSVTSNPLDIAINGGGFFRLQNATGDTVYSRNGQFQLDKNGYIVNAKGQQLMGYPLDATTGKLAANLAPLQLFDPTSASDNAPVATGTTIGSLGVQLNVNVDSGATVIPAATAFSATDSTTYNKSTTATVYDSLGNTHTMTVYFRKLDPTVGPPPVGNWNVYTSLDGGTATAATAVTFDSNGALSTTPATNGVIPQTFTVTTGANDLTFNLDLSNSTQYGSAFAVNSVAQDGYASGKLAGFSIGTDGVITGRYTNGQSKSLGQVVLASFRNPQGLQPLGDNTWAITSDSGPELTGAPGSSGQFGPVQSSALEDSNVDLTKELVDMIVQQRVYQANAQTIKTQDQVLQTLVNLR
jgi:flagellar hook protein FlgE